MKMQVRRQPKLSPNFLIKDGDIQLTDVNAVISQIDTGYSQYEWDGLSINVRPLISLEESIELVDTVIQSCINPKSHMFMPELIDLLFRVSVIRFYTDLDLPDTLQNQHLLVYGTSIYDDVLEVVQIGQIESMQKCLQLFAMHMLGGGRSESWT